jgi:CRP-like cAMP-binding protein
VIDRIRHDIQERLDQLLSEADKLRRALTALGSRDGAPPARQERSKPAAAKAPSRRRRASTSRSRAGATSAEQPNAPAVEPPKAPAATNRTRSRSGAPAPSASTRAASGTTKGAVLAALANGESMTAGDVAKATGVARGTASTTLSNLAKSGEVTKAERGYRLAEPAKPSA